MCPPIVPVRFTRERALRSEQRSHPSTSFQGHVSACRLYFLMRRCRHTHSRHPHLRRRRRPIWRTTTTDATTAGAAAVRPQGGRAGGPSFAPLPLPLPLLASRRQEGSPSGGEDTSPPASRRRSSSARGGGGGNEFGGGGGGGGAAKGSPLSGKAETRPRIPLPPLQRALAAAASGRDDDVSVEQMQASIEDLLGMQGLGSGSWNKSGGVPAAVEREQRTLVREIKVRTWAVGLGGRHKGRPI